MKQYTGMIFHENTGRKDSSIKILSNDVNSILLNDTVEACSFINYPVARNAKFTDMQIGL